MKNFLNYYKKCNSNQKVAIILTLIVIPYYILSYVFLIYIEPNKYDNSINDKLNEIVQKNQLKGFTIHDRNICTEKSNCWDGSCLSSKSIAHCYDYDITINVDSKSKFDLSIRYYKKEISEYGLDILNTNIESFKQIRKNLNYDYEIYSQRYGEYVISFNQKFEDVYDKMFMEKIFNISPYLKSINSYATDINFSDGFVIKYNSVTSETRFDYKEKNLLFSCRRDGFPTLEEVLEKYNELQIH